MENKEFCRCCLGNFCFKDMCDEYEFRGVKETYRDMLLDTFNLKLSQRVTCRQLICEDCITKLRDASAFRVQVMRAEEAIRHGYIASNATLVDDPVVYNIKLEREEDPENNESIQSIDLLESSKVQEVFVKVEALDQPFLDTTTILDNYSPGKSMLLEKPTLSKRKLPVSKYKLELKRDRENTLALILNSNMCLFISLKTKYRCYFCTQAFFKIQDLRVHSKIHSNTKEIEHKFKRFTGLSYINVDISNLECKLCSESCENLSELGTHLKNEHKLPFRNSNHFLIPYELESGFHCLVCNESFKKYLTLSIHMNTHFTNHVCEICGVSFINKLSLRAHINAVHTVKSCPICQTTFRTVSSKAQHMRKNHNHKHSKRYCLECGKTFLYTYLLEQHKIQEHGAKKQTSKCLECDKSFLSQNGLRIHVRSVHLRERNHACDLCEMRFFTSSDKRRHMNTHDNARSFSCHFCEGKFKSKDSFRRHLKKQHGQIGTSLKDQSKRLCSR